MLRSPRERLLQAVLYEAIGLAILTPAYGYAMGLPLGNSFVTMALISGIVIVWAPTYNAIFDRLMLRWSGRLAHQKTVALRILHAGLYEVTISFFAVPIIAYMSGMGWWVAIIADIGFTIVYFAYTYVFYLIYDWLRPVR
ncbi:MAG: PACE efflux transporter [Parvibaculum sp.]|uniref:PACE efflux transporter n=1 Tax=Parvibaculum sp. TaxID=2024848 RepID=UPI003C744AD1